MKAALSALVSKWFLGLVVVLVVSALIWVFGPRLAFDEARPFASEAARLVSIVVLLVLWGLFARRDAVSGIDKAETAASAPEAKGRAADAAPPAGPNPEEQRTITRELAAVDRMLRETMRQLRRAIGGVQFGGGWRYALPWYLVLGPQGAGKSMLLAHSTLSFPLAEPGTLPTERETIWAERAGLWLSDEAVFVEPPGDLFEDAATGGIAAQVWQGLLSALRRNRPRQPLNGIILALPLPDLLQRDEAQLRAAASHLRERLREVQNQTGQNLPVYLVLTQSDRLAGFEEFFDFLPADQRRQVLGITLPALGPAQGDTTTTSAAIAALAPEFEALIERLNQQVPARLHQEPDITRRGLAFAFPQQLALSRGALELFLGEVFRTSRYEDRRILRGVYFTSSEQGGDCVDLMRGAMVGLVPEAAVGRAGGWNAGIGRRDFFIASVLRDVVLRDATAIGLEPGHERRRRRRGAMASVAVVVLGGLVALAWRANYADTHRLIDQNLRAQAWASQVTSAMMEPAGLDRRIAVPDFDVVAQPLRGLRTSRDEITQEVSHRPARGLLGLYQGADVARSAAEAYENALRAQFLPRLLLHLEQRMVDPDLPMAQLYQLLRAYLILGGQGPMQRSDLQDAFSAEWLQLFPAASAEPLRAELAAHLQALSDLHLEPPLALDMAIVDHARARLSDTARGERGMSLLAGLAPIRALPPFRLSEVGGPLTARALARRSGASLQDGVPGLFTAQGFVTLGKPSVDAVALSMAREGWVMGLPADPASVVQETAELRAEILQVYAERYARAWEEVLADLGVVALLTPEQAAEALTILGGPTSPLRRIYVAAATQTDLMAAADAAAAESPVQGAVAAAGAALASAPAAGDVARAFGLPGVSDNRLVEQLVSDRFAPLRELVGPTGEGAQMVATLDRLRDAGQAFTRITNAAAPETAILALLDGSATDGVPLPALLANAAIALPQPLGATLGDLSDEVRSLGAREAQGMIAAQWSAQVAPVCNAITFQRFPLDPQADDQVTTEDFVALYGPGGLIDTFFTEKLAPLIDQSAQPWRWHAVRAGDLDFAADTPGFFQSVHIMRQALFPDGAGAPTVRFQLRPRTLDAAADRVNLQLGETRLSYAHGVREFTSFEWVAADDGSIRLFLTPPLPGQPDGITSSGPWALFAFLREAVVLPSELADRFLLRVPVGARSVSFELQSSSIANPFGRNLFAGLTCPDRL